MSMKILKEIDELLQKRDELLLKGIEMTNVFAELDQDAVTKYDIPDTESFNAKILPWIELKNQCVLWHCDIFSLVQQQKIDLPVWCDLLCAPRAFDIRGLGSGYDYSASVIDQIKLQLFKGLDVLKRISGQTPKGLEPSIHEATTEIRAISFKDLGDDQNQQINFVLNGRFERIRETANKGAWKNLYKLARDGSIAFDTDSKAKKFKDYFNSEKRNQLYSTTQFVRKPLLEVQKKTLVRCVQGIDIHILSTRTWARRVNEARSAVKQ